MMEFTGFIGVSSSVNIEVWALRDGLLMWISFNLLIIEIDIDAKVLFDLVAKTYSTIYNI